jgi:hypothetical protein
MNVGTAVCLNASLIDASRAVSYEATAVWSETGDEVLREHLSECPTPIPIDKVLKLISIFANKQYHLNWFEMCTAFKKT